ncbi:MAG TPA: ABC transporter ATP-binding protein [Thermoleophilia bacterium]|nr:ABC transporter ATP-binding protein [Thermoleophilia bacterium]
MSAAPPRGPRGPIRAREGWRLLRAAVGAERWLIVGGVAAGLAWTACKLTVPQLTQRAIDQGIVANRKGALLHWGVFIALVGIVSGCCTAARRMSAFGVAYRVETTLRQRLYAHLQRLHFAFHDSAQTGQLMARAATDLQQIQQLVVLIPISISNLFTVGGAVVLSLLINVKLTLLAFGALPLLNLAAKRFSTRIHPVSMQLQQELASVATVVEETVTGIRAVKGFGAEPVLTARMQGQSRTVFSVSMRLARIRAMFNPVLDFLPAVGLVAVIWYGGHEALHGHLTPGQFVQFLTYVLLTIVPLRMTGQLVAQAQRAVAAAQRLEEIFSTEPAIADRPGACELPRGRGEVRFEAVRFAYELPNPLAPILHVDANGSGNGSGDGSGNGHEPPEVKTLRPVLDGFDLTLRPGEAVALVGPTGSGKTTVARLIPRFYDADDGRILLDGVDVRDVRLRDLRQAVGIVFEDTFLFSSSVRGNIAFADPTATQADVERAAKLSGAHDFIGDLPDGYDTVLGEQGFSLSGGQRQRIALARAILADPRVLILDDATSSVDPTKEHEIRGALTEVMRGRTTLVIAHRQATIALADRVVLLDEGRVVAEGTHQELLSTNARYREVLARAEAEGQPGAPSPRRLGSGSLDVAPTGGPA